MKKATLFMLSLFLTHLLTANPIFLESIIREIYFENDEWYLAIDNFALLQFGIEDFEYVSITCNEGPLLIMEDFLPDSLQEFTILTNDNLYYPVQIPRTGDSIVSSWQDPNYGSFEFTKLVWNDEYPSPVCGPLEGQSLYVTGVYITEELMDWWLVKNNNPVIFNSWNPDTRGEFTGYVLDLNSNPVPNAQIHYIDESFFFQYPGNPFEPLWTDESGYFQIDYIPARNYLISKITKSGQNFFMNEYVSIEPGTNYFEFTIDYIVGTAEKFPVEDVGIINYPNPFSVETTFEIHAPPNRPFSHGILMISNLYGQTVSILPISSQAGQGNAYRFKWSNPGELPSGSYLVNLVIEGRTEASWKIIISP